ncbi:GFA family protein [Erythrobacter arachoides]|uniref:GFA family protein n=1 Tax=Aurantiacibacter arachoides TaxID=1850444 RepID=A0A845A1A9_9SPHN|nr:GFA family protein [Aurantiacibacter arachoides]MXO92916.1 GFA family protein [Aurantiacibacter arachoides]GGD53434.1 hypothetical protein GCM10011411_11690 [Aurantiacibacter arachoides]
MTTIRKGACHCRTVQYAAEFPDERLVASRCNCSMCAMKGAVMVYVPVDAVAVTAGEDLLDCYSFNTGAAKHRFCSVCGIHLFHQARSDPDKYAINTATLEGVDPYDDFAIVPVFDGRNHSSDNGGVRRKAGDMHFEATLDEMWPNDLI